MLICFVWSSDVDERFCLGWWLWIGYFRPRCYHLILQPIFSGPMYLFPSISNMIESPCSFYFSVEHRGPHCRLSGIIYALPSSLNVEVVVGTLFQWTLDQSSCEVYMPPQSSVFPLIHCCMLSTAISQVLLCLCLFLPWVLLLYKNPLIKLLPTGPWFCCDPTYYTPSLPSLGIFLQ